MDGTEFSTAFDPIEVGNLVARLAVNDAEIGAAQALRYRVFYEEMSAHPSAEVEAAKRDFDRFDASCDHLLVIDTIRMELPAGVGTYRPRSSVANRNGGFYTSDEYEIWIVGTSGETLELGRSRVEAEYRNRPTMQLWQSIRSTYSAMISWSCSAVPACRGPIRRP